MPKFKTCGLCKGRSWCWRCGGKQKIGKWVTKRCPVCNGRANCPRCGGRGKVKYV